MTVSPWFSVALFLVAICAAGLACWLFVRRRSASSYLSLAALCGAVSLAHIANAVGLLDEAHEVLWRRFALVAELFQPAALFHAGIQFLNPAQPQGLGSRRWVVRVMAVVGMLLAALTMTELVFVWLPVDGGGAVIVLAPYGHVPYAFVVVAMALGLAQLETVLRASSEPVRYRLKLIVIGLGGLAGYQIYQASQMLLLPIWRPEQAVLCGMVTMLSLSVLALGIGRNRFKDVLVNAYVSQQALVGSVTFIAIGLYLLAIGVIGAWLRRMHQPLGEEFSVVIVFGALVGLAIAVFSKTVRTERFAFRLGVKDW